jgi:aerobic C4-dicarboxylate transport protein
MSSPESRQPWYRILYVQVIIAVVLGILVGKVFPEFGKDLKPLGDGFIGLVKMMIAPIIFCTVVHGIASMGDLKKLGRVGGKTLLYFEVVSTVALIVGLLVVNVLKPGEGFTPAGESFHTEAKAAVDTSHGYGEKAKAMSTTEFLLNIIPKTFFSPFVTGDLLQVLLISILIAFAITSMGERGKPVLNAIEYGAEAFFGLMRIVVKAAPIGAFGAMGYTVGSYGIGALNKLLALMAGFYLTSGLFVIIVLGGIAWFSGFSIFLFLGHIKDELLLVLGTSSSETALPGMIQKMQQLGCSKSTVGLVIPTGYSFNLDGTNIYMCMAAVFLAQATNTPLDLHHQISLLFVAMVTSKGASGVTGAGFVTLAATIQAVPGIPVESLALLVGIDRFMSECRAITNLIGNGVATVVISRWEREITAEELQANLKNPLTLMAPAPPVQELS